MQFSAQPALSQFVDHFRRHLTLRVFLTLTFGIFFFAGSLQFIKGQFSANGAELLFASSASMVAPGDIFTLNVGIDTPNQPVVSVDTLLAYDPQLLQVIGIEPGTSSLKSMLPGDGTNVDLAQAISISSGSAILDIGLVSFDLSTQQLTPPVQGKFDPALNPLYLIRFKALSSGNATVSFVYTGKDDSTDSNVLSLVNGVPTDILTKVSSATEITIANPEPTPSPIPTPLPSPTIDPSPVGNPAPSPIGSPVPPSMRPLPTPNQCTGYDLNQDNVIDIRDIMLVASTWKKTAADPDFISAYDLDQNGVIDVTDITIISIKWGIKC